MNKKIIKKIQLVLPPSNIGGVGYAGTMVPLGILQIAKAIEDYDSSIKVEVFDGTIMPYNKLISKLDGDLIGISVVSGNYLIGKKIAKKVKKRGALVILGNHHVRYLYEECRKDPLFGKKFKEIDYLIESQFAETTFIELLKAIKENKGFDKIPSVGYRVGQKMIVNKKLNHQKKVRISLKRLLKFIKNKDKYSKNYNKLYSYWHNKNEKIINTNLITGCLQGLKKPCSYCCLRDFKFTFPPPEEFWQEMTYLESKGYTLIFEACNSLSSLKGYVKKLAETRPKKLKIEILAYAKADELDDVIIDYFKKIKIKRLIFGIDSLDEKQLKQSIGKSASIQDNIRIIKKLANSGIEVYACFVPGSKGETKQSLKKTTSFIKQIIQNYNNISTIEFTSFAPMPGSRAWTEIKEIYQQKYGKSDVINISNLAKCYLETFSQVSWTELEKEKKKLEKISKKNHIIYGGYY